MGFLNGLAELVTYNLNQGGFLNIMRIFATINRLTVTRTLVMVMIESCFTLEWAKIMLSSTSSTKDQPRKQILMTSPIFISLIRPLMTPHLLNNIERFLVNYRFLSIFENQPTFLRIIHLTLVFVRFCVSSKIDGVPKIFFAP